MPARFKLASSLTWLANTLWMPAKNRWHDSDKEKLLMPAGCQLKTAGMTVIKKNYLTPTGCQLKTAGMTVIKKNYLMPTGCQLKTGWHDSNKEKIFNTCWMPAKNRLA
mgnify:FL=1